MSAFAVSKLDPIGFEACVSWRLQWRKARFLWRALRVLPSTAVNLTGLDPLLGQNQKRVIALCVLS